MLNVSVVIPVRNRERWIARALDSAFAQTVLPAEVIVVDDGSTDGTMDVVDRYGERVRVLRRGGGGAYAARNAGIRAATSPLIAFLDSDDAWLPTKLERQLPLFDGAQTGVVFGDVRIVRDGKVVARAFERTPPGEATQRDFARGNFIPFTTAVVRRECFDRCGFFDEALSADYVAFFRIARRYRLARTDDVVAEYTLHGENWSSDLEASLRSRLMSFAAERDRSADAAERQLLEQILFTLRLQLRIASLRGKARSAIPPPSARGTARLSWAGFFLWNRCKSFLNARHV
jgi:glycosyltransferase involved in cell wall biosynthesis